MDTELAGLVTLELERHGWPVDSAVTRHVGYLLTTHGIAETRDRLTFVLYDCLTTAENTKRNRAVFESYLTAA